MVLEMRIVGSCPINFNYSIYVFDEKVRLKRTHYMIGISSGSAVVGLRNFSHELEGESSPENLKVKVIRYARTVATE
jgi:hypothetical protein